MRKVIHKFELKPSKNQEILMPVGAKILKIDAQFNSAMIWALVDPQTPMEVRKFVIVKTGEEFVYSDNFNYIGTFLIEKGVFVFHCFEVL